MKSILLTAFALTLPLAPVAKKQDAAHSEAVRFLCKNEADLAHDIGALRNRLKRIFKKEYDLKVSHNAVVLEFHKVRPTERQMDELLNTGLIEIMIPANPIQDPTIKSAHDFVERMNQNLKEINRKQTIPDYIWEKRHEFNLPATYEIDVVTDYAAYHSAPIREPIEILLTRKKPLFENSDFKTIEYFSEKSEDIPERHGLAIKLSEEATARFTDYTTKNKGTRLFIYIDKEFISGPMIHEPITGGTLIISRASRVKEFFKMIAHIRKNEFYKCQVVSA